MNRAAGRRNSASPEKFLKPVCGISVVKRKITPVFTEVIFYLVDSKGIQPSTSAMRTQRSPEWSAKRALFQSAEHSARLKTADLSSM